MLIILFKHFQSNLTFEIRVRSLEETRHDAQHNNIQHNDTQHNDTQHNGLIHDIQHK
jgi:hypothetical protein